MTNRLADSPSLYLRKHAENPIDWWPWCESALEQARRENKPVFLSIGYSSCHWCTVMEGEAFSDAAIADYMNANFLPIKVDREERPDVDSIYMQALQMLTGQGGWPLNVVLSPENLVPFYGGTYFPIEPKYGRPGFLQVLMALRRFYDQEKGKLQAVTTEIFKHLQDNMQLPVAKTLDPDLLQQGMGTSARVLEPTGHGTCFPMMPYAEAALRGVNRLWEGLPDCWQLCQQRGRNLVLGGIYDQVAGGFHRYTVDPHWTVPHFEKMLYDNGQILGFLANLWAAGAQDSAIKRAMEGTVTWLQREMTDRQGYFYAAQDADNFVTPSDAEPEEGAFYAWSYDALVSLLSPAEIALLEANFTISQAGNFDGQNVLQRTQPGALAPAVEQVLQKLFRARYGATPEQVTRVVPARNNQEAKTTSWPGRIPPVTDTKMIVAWNSLMISGLAKAAIALERPDFVDLAADAVRFIVEQQQINGRLHRLNYDGQPHGVAQAEDYAFLIQAMIDLHQAQLAFTVQESTGTAAANYLQLAIQLQAEFDQYLWEPSQGGYINTPTDSDHSLLVQERAYQDNATPSANGIGLTNLIRLALLTEDLQYLDRAEQGLKVFGAVLKQIPQACPSLLVALDWLLHGIAVKTTAEHLPGLMRHSFSQAVFSAVDDLPAGAVGLVCQGLACEEPARSIDQLLQQLQASRNRSARPASSAKLP